MKQRLGQTPSQTVGPFYSMRLAGEGENVLPVPDGGQRIVVKGRVFDADGRHVEDALIETWQANPLGGYNHPDDRRELGQSREFTGFARAQTDFETGEFRIETAKPGRVPDPEGELQAPHIGLIIQGRGMLNPLFTRVYFSDEPHANQDDIVLRTVPADRRSTLIAMLEEGSDPPTYVFDVRLQGASETVFFDV